MLQTLIGQKIDQTQTFLENGKRIPVTEVSVVDNVVIQVKTDTTDEYTAVQLGVGAMKKPIKARLGHAKLAGLEKVPTFIREVAWIGDEELPKSGDIVTVESVFQPGDIVKVTGTSKGKAFAGGVKRYGFRGGPKTHGQSDRHRAPGSIGQGTTPGRVYKGKKMAGHMGVDTVTISNLVVVDVDSKNKKLYVLGLVPGYKKASIVITKTGEQKKFVRLLSTKLKEDAEAAKEAEKLAKEQEKAAAEKPAESEVKEEAPVEVVEAAEEVKTEEAVAKPDQTVADATETVKEEVSGAEIEEVSDEVSNEIKEEATTEDSETSAEEQKEGDAK
jgi:large subunit ribosomal protein L3